MKHAKLCTRFRFDKTGTTKNALFSGPVVLMEDGLFLVAKSVTTETANTAMAAFGIFGALFLMFSNALPKMEFPYPDITCTSLPEQIRALKGFGKLKEKHRIVVVKRDEIHGHTTSFIKGFRVQCAGEDIALLGSQRKLKATFLAYGYPECDPKA